MNILANLQAFISQYQVLFISLGVPILTVLISWFVAAQTNRTSRKLAEKERALSVQLKLAEFRQAWIDGLREDLAAYSAATFHTSDMPLQNDRLHEIVSLGARVMLRMNTKDPDYEAFKTALSHALPSSQEEADAAKTSLTVVTIGQRILKREWERLKSDLDKIDRLMAK
jgi:hypothetical protein